MANTREGQVFFKMRKLACLLALVTFAGLLAGQFIPVLNLEVRERKQGKVFFQDRVNPGETFRFRYVHSVEKTPVEATFEIEKGGILRLVETWIASHGSGLPSIGKRGGTSAAGWSSGGDDLRRESLTFLFTSLNRPLFQFRGKAIPIDTGEREEGFLKISVKKTGLTLYSLDVLIKRMFRPQGKVS